MVLYALEKESALKSNIVYYLCLILRVKHMSLIGMIPDDMFEPDRLDDIIIMLRRLDVPPRRKKTALVDWAQAVGAGLTKEDFLRLLGVEYEHT